MVKTLAEGVRMAILLSILWLWDNKHLPYLVMLFHVVVARPFLKKKRAFSRDGFNETEYKVDANPLFNALFNIVQYDASAFHVFQKNQSFCEIRYGNDSIEWDKFYTDFTPIKVVLRVSLLMR